MRFGWATVRVLALSAATSCGGASSAGGGACGKVQPCGGPLIGTWQMTSICLLDTSGLGIDTSAICQAAWIDTSASTVSGTATFRPDGTYELDELFTPSVRIVVPTSCLAAGESCEALAARLPVRPTTPPVACALEGNTCACPLATSPPITFRESGTASVSGTTVRTTPNTGAAPADVPYCVRGDEVHILALGKAPPGSSMKVIQSDTIATRL